MCVRGTMLRDPVMEKRLFCVKNVITTKCMSCFRQRNITSTEECMENQSYRTADGSCNHRMNFGQSGTPLTRLLPAVYGGSKYSVLTHFSPSICLSACLSEMFICVSIFLCFSCDSFIHMRMCTCVCVCVCVYVCVCVCCLLYTSPSPRDSTQSRMPSSA